MHSKRPPSVRRGTFRPAMPTPRMYLLLAGLAIGLADRADARVDPSADHLPISRARGLHDESDALPGRAPSGWARADTLRFGYYTLQSGAAYAVAGETWTFDHGASDPLEGWYAVDVSDNGANWFRVIDLASWGGHDNEVDAPILHGSRSIWLGRFESSADSLCWMGGLGYGNSWCQRLESPSRPYAGVGNLNVSFDYFSDTELDYDYVQIRVRRADGSEFSLNGLGFTGSYGDPAFSDYPHAAFTATPAQMAGTSSYRVVVQFTSDFVFSDDDGGYSTPYGPLGLDAVTLAESGGASASYGFESGFEGWSGHPCTPVGTGFGVASLSSYAIPDPLACQCGLSGKVVETHDANGGHPKGQHVILASPIVDRGAPGNANDVLFAEWDQWAQLPTVNGVLYRPGWSYYPFVCPESGATQWSPRQGGPFYLSTSAEGECMRTRDVANEGGVPGDARMVRFLYEIYSSCDAFGITSCTNVTNFSPLLDNLEVSVTSPAHAPTVAIPPGMLFQDAAPIVSPLSPSSVANADVAYDVGAGVGQPGRLGDSLVVAGPQPGPTSRWDALLWWRVRREGPSQNGLAPYMTWRTRVADGRNIVGANGQFTFGRMDSVQVSNVPDRSRFHSEFREDDDDYLGEGAEANEMLPDLVFTPGTQIEYFVTAQYITSPTVRFYLPDTTGGHFEEFEILPSYRLVSGVAKFPSVLSLDLDAGTQYYTEHALHAVLAGAPPANPVPNPSLWDRFDYQGADAAWSSPFARLPGRSNGLPIELLRGYRYLVLSTGSLSSPAMKPADFDLLSTWLTETSCAPSETRQGIVIHGDDAAGIAAGASTTFLSNRLGAALGCDDLLACAPATGTDCVSILSGSTPTYPPGASRSAWGAPCPRRFDFDGLAATCGGRVNRWYGGVANPDALAAAITHPVDGAGTAEFRSVLAGQSWTHLVPAVDCPASIQTASVLNAVVGELADASTWIFGGTLPGLRVPPCTDLYSIAVDVRDDPTSTCTPAGGLPRRRLLLLPDDKVVETDASGVTAFPVVPPGGYSVTLLPRRNWMQVCTLGSRQLSVPAETQASFVTRRTVSAPDLVVTGAAGAARAAQRVRVALLVRNLGTTAATTTLRAVLPLELAYVSSAPAGTYTPATRTVEWSVGSLLPDGEATVSLLADVAPIVPLGSQLSIAAEALPSGGDAAPADNQTSIPVPVVATAPAQEMLVAPSELVDPSRTLRYEIRFQNVEATSANRVVIVDTLSASFDLASIEQLAGSHPGTLSFIGRTLTWQLDGPFPTAASSEPLSRGFVAFTAKLDADLPTGTQVSNRAWIQFDDCPRRVTNSTIVTALNPASTPEIPTASFALLGAQPNPASRGAQLRYVAPGPGTVQLEVVDATGRRVRVWTVEHPAATIGSLAWDGEDAAGHALPSGVYFARAAWNGGSMHESRIVYLATRR